jgi:hypothetical protein
MSFSESLVQVYRKYTRRADNPRIATLAGTPKGENPASPHPSSDSGHFLTRTARKWLTIRSRNLKQPLTQCFGKYPPAELGALHCEPLKAVLTGPAVPFAP